MKRIDSANTLASYCIQRLRGVGILHTAKASGPGLRTLAPGLFAFRLVFPLVFPGSDCRSGAGRWSGRCYSCPMSRAVRDSEDVAELKQLYDRLALAVERAAATMHIRGAESTAFTAEDTKCVALWDRIRTLIQKDR